MSILKKEQSSSYLETMGFLEDKLALLNTLNDAKIHDNIWLFKSYTGSTITIDFNLFDARHTQCFTTMSVVFNQQAVILTPVEFAKLLWLEMTLGYHAGNMSYAPPFECVGLLFAYLAEKDNLRVHEKNLEELIGFMLTYDVTNRGVERRISVPSYKSRFAYFSIINFSRILHQYQAEGIVISISRIKYEKAFNNVCLSLMDMTLSDYIKGGNFNFLGLDAGKHYIDHCATFFETNFQFAAAFRQTYDVIIDEVRNKTKLRHAVNIQQGAIAALSGIVMRKGTVPNIKSWTDETLCILRDVTFDVFREKYNNLSAISQLFKVETVNEIISSARLPQRYDVQEFVRAILISHYIGENGKKTHSIFHEYTAAINAEENIFNISFQEFKKLCLSIIKKRSHILPNDYGIIRKFLLRSLDTTQQSLIMKVNRANKNDLFAFVNHVESAGMTLFVGLTGWRRSEYGFPLSSIEISVNTDVLDNLYTPWRFHVEWMVPKTSGKTPLQREITSYAYMVAYMTDKLNLSKSVKPALYRGNLKSNNVFKSANFVEFRIDMLWEDFVENYSMFNELDTLEILDKKSNINIAEKKSLNYLRSRYDISNSEIKMLCQLRDKLREALSRYKLVKGLADNSFGSRLKRYVKGNLEDKWKNIFDSFLSPGIKKKLKCGKYNLSHASVRHISNELLQHDVFPTPHAFRHIWAEAVLLRYRGDVGKFIRANFKHLDERFFMAYLRDKETKAVYQVATRTIINSVVRQHILAMTDNNREYTGGFDRFLSKAVKFTKVFTQEEYEDLSKNIAEKRVIDIKPNAWATCFLRVGTENTAKCSVDGVLQRRNAEPKLCLGCVNADIAKANFNGIVVYIKSDITACRNPRLPAFIKEPHIKTVKIALKRVKELRQNSDNSKYDKFISHLYETLEMSSVCAEIA